MKKFVVLSYLYINTGSYMLTEAAKRTFHKYRSVLEDVNLTVSVGKVSQVNGLSILTEGPGDAKIGDWVEVETANEEQKSLSCEVVGFRDHYLVLMPLGSPVGVFPGAQVSSQGSRISIAATEEMLGRVLDGVGSPLDGGSVLISKQRLPVDSSPPLPTQRQPIRQIVETGVRSIDSMLSIGRGQRMGIFAGAGIGKSSLLGMIARYTKADINVICLVGERGREVSEFIENDLGEEGLKRSVVFVATSDRSAMEKIYAAGFATSAAEFFRDRGYQVNLYLDSITRYVIALREVGIAGGEQIGPGGFPPGVWYHLGRLLERAGNTPEGSITGFYTILVEADDMTEPISDNSRGLLDGHLILSRRLANKGHYPAIAIVDSISRVMDRVASPEHLKNAMYLRRLLAAYGENEELIRLGAYARGSDAYADEAINKIEAIQDFLCQKLDESSSLSESLASLKHLQQEQEVMTY